MCPNQATMHNRPACRVRRVRDLGFFSIMIAGDSDLARIEKIAPKAIILSGGPNSVHEGGSPGVPDGFFDYVDAHEVPLLGICYGMQLITHCLGGTVERSPNGGEFGSMPIRIEPGSTLYAPESEDEQVVWMSHGDDATALPPGFTCVARSKQGARVAIENAERRMFGLQYHPEVVHSKRGHETLRHFLKGIAGAPRAVSPGLSLSHSPGLSRSLAWPCACGRVVVVQEGARRHDEASQASSNGYCPRTVRARPRRRSRCAPPCAGLESDWSMQSAIDTEAEVIRQRVGPDAHVICALSGGVDSTVAATLVHRVIGDRLHCVFVDNGLLRFDEGARVMALFREQLHLPVTMVDARAEMMAKLRGVTDPEAKRKAIGGEFIECFMRFRCAAGVCGK